MLCALEQFQPWVYNRALSSREPREAHLNYIFPSERESAKIVLRAKELPEFLSGAGAERLLEIPQGLALRVNGSVLQAQAAAFGSAPRSPVTFHHHPGTSQQGPGSLVQWTVQARPRPGVSITVLTAGKPGIPVSPE